MLRIYFPRLGNESSYDNRKPREPRTTRLDLLRAQITFFLPFLSFYDPNLFIRIIIIMWRHSKQGSFVFKNSFWFYETISISFAYFFSLGKRSYWDGLYATELTKRGKSGSKDSNFNWGIARRKSDPNARRVDKWLSNLVSDMCNKILNLEKKTKTYLQ